MLLLLHEAKLIGACSIFDYPLRDSMGSSTVIDTDDVVELAVTISDEQQGKKLGTVLLEQAVQVAGADGKTHVYTSFNSSNDRSRRLAERILGSANIVAGKDNLQDKFWRIPGVPADDYMILENAMRLYCGDESTELDDTKRGNRIDRIGKFGRDILSKIPIPHDTESLDTSK
ncbi:MAG: GNAT family N-acetyltransferase [Candidatus Saccharimonadales bacterium]